MFYKLDLYYKMDNIHNIRNRRKSSLSGITVFVVVEVDRSIISRGMVDNQEDIEVKAVFTTKQNAEKYVASYGINRNLVIHETAMNPPKYYQYASDFLC